MAAETELERLIVRLLGDSTSFRKMLDDAVQQTNKAGQQINRVGQQIQGIGTKLAGVGRSMSLFITGPIAAMGAGSVAAFARFDQAMIESTSIMGNLSAETKTRMREVALSLSGEVAQAPAELARSYFFLASAGLDAEQSIAALPAVAKFATAGAFDMALATDLLTDAQSALGLTIRDDVVKNMQNMVRVSDVLVAANTLANATVEQFSIALTSKAGASLKAFNKDIEEGVAVLAAFADQGVKAQLAGNQLDRVIRLLSKSSMDNAEAHRELGFQVFDGAGRMRNLGDIIINLEQILKGMNDQTKVATLDMLGFEARVQQAILPLLGTGDAIKRYEQLLRDATGTTAQVADKQMQSFTNTMKVLRNVLLGAAIEIGNQLAPILQVMANAVKAAVKFWQGLPGPIKTAAIATAIFVAAVGPAVFFLGKSIALIGLVIDGYIKLKAVTVSATIAQWAYNAAVAASVIGLVIMAVGTVAAIVQMQKMKEEAKDQVAEISKMVKAQTELGELAGGPVADGLGDAAEKTDEVADKVKSLNQQLDKQIVTFGMTARQAEIYWLELQNANKVELDLARAADQRLTELERQKEAREDAAEFTREIERLTESLQLQAETFGMSAAEARIYALEIRGATQEQLRAARAAAADVDRLETQKKLRKEQERLAESLRKEGQRVTEQFLTPSEKFEKRRQDLERLLQAGAITQQTFNRAMQAATPAARAGAGAAQSVSVHSVRASALAAEQRARLQERPEAKNDSKKFTNIEENTKEMRVFLGEINENGLTKKDWQEILNAAGFTG